MDAVESRQRASDNNPATRRDLCLIFAFCMEVLAAGEDRASPIALRNIATASETLLNFIEGYSPAKVDLVASEQEGLDCLAHLFEQRCADSDLKIGEIVSNAFKDPCCGSDIDAFNTFLLRSGLRLLRKEDEIIPSSSLYLFVENKSAGLKAIFAKTRWEEGKWREALLAITGVSPSPYPVSVGHKDRGILIPPRALSEAVMNWFLF